ncbi:uncharacterized protein N0V89_006776 [Didymosphaeria variabile]|uniref:Uncharacterized protein n=1 Tax=Didymosphaeria variabile TaxID=1932322 RepID=A0A9W8XI78_9PLEO|nr:uncharacterized protein N0V89_006776 [Didymosphaeria variabile]KAJ4351434.1 hypothetical protein N0V89_006776 [Didymosphaeria variabile]
MSAPYPTPFTAEEERSLKYIGHLAAELYLDDNIKICVSTGFNAVHTNSPYSAGIVTKQDGVHRTLYGRFIGVTRMEALCRLLGRVELDMYSVNVQADMYERNQMARANEEKQEIGEKRKRVDGGGQEDDVAEDDNNRKKLKPKLKAKVLDTPSRHMRSNSVISLKSEGDEQGKTTRSTRATRATRAKKIEEDIIQEDDGEE